MRLMSLHLQNIRSYRDENVAFPKGMTLLAGDIGSGKSTILLALEFALFGIQRGELSGNALLRHGAQRGEVTLTLEIAGNEVRVTRLLKRGVSGVTQEAGSIEIDGVRTEGTAQELKAKVLELLNYPPSLLTKGKRPLFRYTVYTPQEEMKAIIYERADERLDTLRKLFDIDKYKRVRENAITLSRELRREETDKQARIEELGKGLGDEQTLRERRETLKREAAIFVEETKKEEAGLKEAEEGLRELEKARFALEDLKRRCAVAKNGLEHHAQRHEEILAERKRLGEQITRTDLTELDIDEQSLKERESIIKEQERKIKEKEELIIKQASEQEHIINEAEELAKRITSLENCPTCKQGVDGTHKHTIDDECHARKEKAAKRLEELGALREAIKEKRTQCDQKKEELLQKQRLVEANKVKLATLQGLKRQLVSLEEGVQRLEKEMRTRGEELKGLEKELAESKGIDEEQYVMMRRRVEERRKRVGERRVRAAELQKDIEALTKEEERLKRQGEERKQHETALARIRRRLAWLNKHLLTVSHAIEKAMFTNIYGLFNEYFKEWFATLLEDETISVRLDQEFTPVITQDGYETSIEHLSGGEKTSVALAYRLSLNKVINEFLSSINTRDLLILDEPTDGFSSEQLDRVREVLEQLHLEQVLIVSHEQQMEGYVDHVLRVEKREHESVILRP